MKKKVLGVVLSVIMLISLVSTAALACDDYGWSKHSDRSSKECSYEKWGKDCSKEYKEETKEECKKDCEKDCDDDWDCDWDDCDWDCDDLCEWIPDVDDLIDWIPDWCDYDCDTEECDPSVYCVSELTPVFDNLVYTGLEQYPDIVLNNSKGETMDEDDYCVWFDPEVDSIDVGEYGFIITGTHPFDLCSKVVGYGGYCYQIVARDIADPNIAASVESPFYYTSEEITPVPSFVNGWTGNALVEGTDFEIVVYANNIEVGTASVTVRGIGNYTGETTLNFEIIPNEYKFTKGDGQSITKGRGAEGVFETNGNVNFFEGLKVDGSLLEEGKDYTISGNDSHTVITLKSHAIKNLKTGKHTIEAIYHDGSCSGTFTLVEGVKAPKTADTTNLILWVAALVAGLGAAGFAVSRKRRAN